MQEKRVSSLYVYGRCLVLLSSFGVLFDPDRDRAGVRLELRPSIFADLDLFFSPAEVCAVA